MTYTKNQIAEQALFVLVRDLGYSNDIRPLNGYAPIRHQLMWEMCEQVLCDSFKSEVDECIARHKNEGNKPPLFLQIDLYKEIDRLRAENQRMREALEVARKHISGNAEKFSERERTPVLFQINEALGE